MASIHELLGKYVQERQQVSSLGQELTQKRAELTDLEKALTGAEVKDALTKEIQDKEKRVAQAKKALEAGQLQEGYDALFNPEAPQQAQEALVCVAPTKKDILAGLDIELQSNKLASFSENLERLQHAGYNRHIRPAELVEVLSRYFEGERTFEQLAENFTLTKHYDDQITWVGLAARTTKDGKGIEFVLDPELSKVYSGYIKFVEDQLKLDKCEYKTTFDLLSFSNAIFLPDYHFGTAIRTTLHKLPNEIVEFICGRRFEDLPKELKDLELALRLSENEWSFLAFGKRSNNQFYLTNAPMPSVASYSIGVKDYTPVKVEDEVPTTLENNNGGKKNERSIKQVYSS